MSKNFIIKRNQEKHLRNEMREISKDSENKIKNNETVMDERIKEVNNIMNDKSSAKLPKRKVKVDKKDKGLFERTEDSTILITEDNKFILND